MGRIAVLVVAATLVVNDRIDLTTAGPVPAASEREPATNPSDFAARLHQIAEALPAKPTGVGRTITDRAAWQALAGTEQFKALIHESEEIAGRAIPPQPDELYLDFSRTGDRATWETVAFRRRRDVGVLTLAECAEDRGRFIPKIREYVDALCAERTWVWSGHDPKLLNFNENATDIDLGAAELAWQLATVRWLLAERLPRDASANISTNIRRRIVEPFRASVTGKTKAMVWTTRTNNWNPVCYAGVVGATLATVDDRETRALFVASAERDAGHYLRGFGADGYCGEGLGYWNYGFGHYVLLAETVRQATGGVVDLMARPGVRSVATFGSRIQIMHGIAPAFADCDVDAKPAPQVVRYVNARFGLGLSGSEHPLVKSERSYLYEEVMYAFLDPGVLASLAPKSQTVPTTDSPLHSWFEQSAVLVARPAAGSTCRVGIAFKGGNNAKSHNHNDLGSFVVVLGDRPVLLDPGRENYTARTFGPRRYESKLINSYGHCVPIVAGKLQSSGVRAVARILKADFDKTTDTVVMDLTSAYEVPELKHLQRTFVYDRSGDGSLTVTDHAEFSSPQSFGTALITLGGIISHDGDRLVIGDAGQHLVIEVKAGDAYTTDVEIIRENAPVTPTRIGLNLSEKTGIATISVKIFPEKSRPGGDPP